MSTSPLLTLIKRIKSISDIGLLYAKDEFDRERYTELQEISFDMLEHITGQDIQTLQAAFPPAADYPTAKVDIRGMLLTPDKKILLVRESTDGKWSLPGGWGDIGYSPKETVIKEFKEETGLDVTPVKLLAVFDKKLHPHPPQPFYVYKMVFLCEALSTDLLKGFDMLDVEFFDIDNLPELSTNRILQSQIELLYHNYLDTGTPAYFD